MVNYLNMKRWGELVLCISTIFYIYASVLLLRLALITYSSEGTTF